MDPKEPKNLALYIPSSNHAATISWSYTAMQCHHNAMQCNYTDLVHHADTVLMSLPCSQVAAFRRCGGRSAMAGINAPDPGICCESGTLCKFYNEYFWQCQPRGYVPLPEPEATFDGPSCKGKTQVGRCSMMDRPLHLSHDVCGCCIHA
jgi:hypothetical protein